jgi:hypothetical protein
MVDYKPLSLSFYRFDRELCVVSRPRFGCLEGPTGAYCDLSKYVVTCF